MILLATVCLLVISAPRVSAEYIIGDAGFQATSVSGNSDTEVSDVAWIEENHGVPFAEFAKSESAGNAPDDGDATPPEDDVYGALGDVGPGRFYQQIGSYGGESVLPVALTIGDQSAGGQFGTLDLELWVGGDTTIAGDGVNLGGGVGALLDHVVQFSSADVPEDSVARVLANLQFNSSASASVGDPVWLALSTDETSNTTELFDDLNIVPEPAIGAMVILLGLAILRRRRHK